MGTGSDGFHASGSNYTDQGGVRTVIGGELDIVSGGELAFEDGGRFVLPVTALGTSQVATNITNFGVTTITASTTAPTYTLAAPVPGAQKVIAVTANTSSGTANVNTNATGVSVSSSGDNQLNFNSIRDRVLLFGASTSAWLLTSAVGSTNLGVGTGTQST